MLVLEKGVRALFFNQPGMVSETITEGEKKKMRRSVDPIIRAHRELYELLMNMPKVPYVSLVKKTELLALFAKEKGFFEYDFANINKDKQFVFKKKRV